MLYRSLLAFVLAMREVLNLSYFSAQQVKAVFAAFLSRQLKTIS